MKGLLLMLLAAVSLSAAPTFNQDIAPILFEHCSPCHRPGEIAPFPLLTYQDARRHASQIVSVTKSRYMPPWPPEAQADEFIGTRRLNPKQLALIADWVRTGAAEGAAVTVSALPTFSEGWQLGPPDLIVQVPQPFTLPAAAGDVFRNFVIPVDIPSTVFIRAIEIRPGERKLLHHANLVLDRARTLRRRDGLDGQPGFPGMDVITESGETFDPDSHFLFWKPGSSPQTEPADMAWRLDPDTDLVLNLHLQPSGKPEQVQPTVGLYFTESPPTRFPMLLQLEHDGAIDIPAGSKSFQIEDHLTLPIAVDVLEIYPHAHYLGKRIEAWAKLPDGSRRQLIRIEDWDLNWQSVYTYRKPVHLPKGTVVDMRIVYDNTAANARNPHSPPERVHNGDKATDEMGHVWLQVVPTETSPADPRIVLQEAVMSRRLEKYPADFLAHYNLGAVYALRGNQSAAAAQYLAALKIDPAHAASRNALASSLAAAGRNEEAIREWRETIRRQPLYGMAHFNLARMLTAFDDAPGAIAQYQTFLEQQPDDAQGHLNLGALYIDLHRYSDAIVEYRRVAELKPGDTDVLTNLGTLLARSGDLSAAINAFRRALVADPSNRVAQANLTRAQEAQSK
jgi:Flp pilus assembly protein TadD